MFNPYFNLPFSSHPPVDVDLHIQSFLSTHKNQQKIAALRLNDDPSVVSSVKETSTRYHDLKSQAEAQMQSINTQRAAQSPPLPPVQRHKAVKACEAKDRALRDILDLAISVDLRPRHGFEKALDASVARGLKTDRIIGAVLFLDDSIKFVEWWLKGINSRLWKNDGSWDLGIHGTFEEQVQAAFQQMGTSSTG